MLGGTIGACVTQDPLVGVSSGCAELILGIDGRPRDDFHLDFELGLGSTLGVGADYLGPVTTGATSPQPSTGAHGGFMQGSGGFHITGRFLVGYDPAARLFLRLGAEYVATAPLGFWASGLHGVFDIGTRVGLCSCVAPDQPPQAPLELGVRTFAGSDGIVSTDGNTSTASLTFGYGVQLLSRYVWR